MPPPPNILWILTTQWRAQALGHAGDANARTPNLDALATGGGAHPDAVTPHPFGPFARAAILTGVPSPENGIADYYDPLPPESATVATALNERGYSTAFFGKWHLYRRDPGASLTGEVHARIVVPAAFRGGFAFWEGFESGFLLNGPWLHGTRLETPTRFEGYQSDVVCGRALDYLRGRPGPWFAVLSLEAPHPPYAAPAAGVRAREPASVTLRGNVPAGGPADRARRELVGYYAHLEATDRAIGRLVAGLPGNVRLAMTSVHGDMHGSHGLFRKGWPHEESVRVPLLLRSPERIRPDAGPWSLLGLKQAALDWADGGSPDWSGGEARISMPSVVRLPDQCDRTWTGIRSGRRKLVLGADGSPWLFFDLETDPLELRNLADSPSDAGTIAALAARIKP